MNVTQFDARPIAPGTAQDPTPFLQTPPETPAAEGGWNGASIFTLAMLTATFAFNYFDRLLISLLFPFIQKDLSLSDTDLGLISGVTFVLVYSFMGIPVSRIADRGSRKWIIGLGFSFWSMMTFLTGFVSSFWQLAATRFLMGAGESTGTPPSSAMLSDVFDKKRRPIAFSIMVSGTSISGLLLTPAAGWIAQLYGWRAAYWSAGSIGLVFGIVLLLTVKEPPRGRFDVEAQAADGAKPAFWPSLQYLLQRPTYLWTTLAASLFIISFYAYIVWNTTFVVRVHHMSVAHSASLFGPVGGISGLVGGLCSGPALAWLSRRDERWQIWLPALCFVASGAAQYLFLFSPGIPGMIVAAAIGGFAVTMAVPLISLVLIQILPARIRTFGMAMYFFANSLLGDIMGPLVVGMLNDHFQAIWGLEAIRRSMSTTAAVSIIAAPVLLLAGRSFNADRRAAETWDK